MKTVFKICGILVAVASTGSLSFAQSRFGQQAAQQALSSPSGGNANQGKDCNPGTQSTTPYGAFAQRPSLNKYGDFNNYKAKDFKK